MVIRVQQEGGIGFFPRLAEPVTVDTASLPQDEATALVAAVTRADFSPAAAKAAEPAPGSADHRTYTITVVDGPETRMITVSDPILDPALSEIVGKVLAKRS
jgi:hypothetical protein